MSQNSCVYATSRQCLRLAQMHFSWGNPEPVAYGIFTLLGITWFRRKKKRMKATRKQVSPRQRIPYPLLRWKANAICFSKIILIVLPISKFWKINLLFWRSLWTTKFFMLRYTFKNFTDFSQACDSKHAHIVYSKQILWQVNILLIFLNNSLLTFNVKSCSTIRCLSY